MIDVEVKRGADGVWFTRLYLGTHAVTKKPLRPYKRFPRANSEEEALEQARIWASSFDITASMGINRNLGDIAMKYIESVEAKWSPKTAQTYRSLVSAYITPHIGQVDPDDVKPYMIEQFYKVLLISGSRSGQGLSVSIIIKIHWFLSGCFKWMIGQGITLFNPMISVNKPSPDDSQAVSLMLDELDRLEQLISEILDAEMRDTQSFLRRNVAMAAYLALHTGARCGEVCGLILSDINYAARSITVRATACEVPGQGVVRKLKTKGKRLRVVSVGDAVLDAVKEHIAWRTKTLKGTKDNKRMPICVDANGGMLRPSKVCSTFKEFCAEADLPNTVTFHSLRHTHATMLLAQGVDVKTVQERLGQASPALTLKVYAHVLPGRDREAAEAFEELSRTGGGCSDR